MFTKAYDSGIDPSTLLTCWPTVYLAVVSWWPHPPTSRLLPHLVHSRLLLQTMWNNYCHLLSPAVSYKLFTSHLWVVVGVSANYLAAEKFFLLYCIVLDCVVLYYCIGAGYHSPANCELYKQVCRHACLQVNITSCILLKNCCWHQYCHTTAANTVR